MVTCNKKGPLPTSQSEPVPSTNFRNLSRFLCRPSFRSELVRSFPGVFYLRGRRHPAFVGAAAGDPLELSRTVRILPRALDRDLPAGRLDLPFKGADVAVSVGVHVHEVAALRTVAVDQVRGAPVGDFRVLPIVVA